MQRVVKPRNQRSKRALDAREPKAIENDKVTIFVKGQQCSETVKACMKDFHALKRPHAVTVSFAIISKESFINDVTQGVGRGQGGKAFCDKRA